MPSNVLVHYLFSPVDLSPTTMIAGLMSVFTATPFDEGTARHVATSKVTRPYPRTQVYLGHVAPKPASKPAREGIHSLIRSFNPRNAQADTEAAFLIDGDT